MNLNKMFSGESGAHTISFRVAASSNPPDPSHERVLGSFVKIAEQKFTQLNTAAFLRSMLTDSGLPTAVNSPSLKLAEVASIAPRKLGKGE